MILPVEKSRIGMGLNVGPAITLKYNTVCCVPGCGMYSVERHHVIPRSYLKGAYDYVEIDGKVMPNVVFICPGHHLQVTGGIGGHKAKFVLGVDEWVWVRLTDEEREEHEGKCPQCKRPYPKKRQPQAERPKATFQIRVPRDERENGVQVIEELMQAAREALRRDEHQSWKYYTLVEVLAFFVQHAHLLETTED